MPNQLNFPDPIASTKYQRPYRISVRDRGILKETEYQVPFGTDPRDVVEIWIYNADGSVEGHLALHPSDPTLTINTLIDQSGSHEILNIDMVVVAKKLLLQPGRYAMAMHCFRNEVGSEEGYKLFISDISPDRTEVKLEPVDPKPASLADVYEFAEPSVPKLYAQALIDEVFGLSLDSLPAERISSDKLADAIEIIIAGTMSKIREAGVSALLYRTLDTISVRTHKLALDLMANDVRNLNIQEAELIGYVHTALDQVLYDMDQKGEIPPHFRLV